MRPTVIVHNTIGLDGAVTGVDIDVGLHYEVAGGLATDGHLIGSGTARAGIEMFEVEVPPETDEDRQAPPPGGRPLWVIPDSGARLQGLLHVLRRSDFCADLVVLVADGTPDSYLTWLAERSYLHHRVGGDRVDLAAALDLLAAEYGIERVMVDGGPSLVGALLDQGLVDELSLVLAPGLGGVDEPGLFDAVSMGCELELIGINNLDGNAVHLSYRVAR